MWISIDFIIECEIALIDECIWFYLFSQKSKINTIRIELVYGLKSNKIKSFWLSILFEKPLLQIICNVNNNWIQVPLCSTYTI